MSALRKRWILLRNSHARVEFGRGVYLGPGFSLHVPGKGTFVVGDGVEFRRNCRVEIWHGGVLTIGAGSVATYDVVIQCSTQIEIGERCVLAQAVTVADGSHRFRDLDRPVLEQGYDFRPIHIGDGAAIMAKATVIASIGERAFIGANTVVNRPVSPYTLAVGTPVREVERYDPSSAG